jgi:signal transduction histidine kinase
MRDSEENILHWMGIALDIHDRRQAAAALEDADRRKDEFLATLAHELRNPLAPLRNALYLLQLREHGVDAQPIHDIMDRQLRQLARVTRGKIGCGAALSTSPAWSTQPWRPAARCWTQAGIRSPSPCPKRLFT